MQKKKGSLRIGRSISQTHAKGEEERGACEGGPAEGEEGSTMVWEREEKGIIARHRCRGGKQREEDLLLALCYGIRHPSSWPYKCCQFCIVSLFYGVTIERKVGGGGAQNNRGLEARGARAIMRHRTERVRKWKRRGGRWWWIDNAIQSLVV